MLKNVYTYLDPGINIAVDDADGFSDDDDDVCGDYDDTLHQQAQQTQSL